MEMLDVIVESATAPTEATWRRLRTMYGIPPAGLAGQEYTAVAEERFAKLRESVEARQKRAKVHESVRAWINHIASLAARIEAGCVYRENDLTPEEWRGLDCWRQAKQQFSDSHVKCPGCGRAIPRGQSADICGWKEEGK